MRIGTRHANWQQRRSGGAVFGAWPARGLCAGCCWTQTTDGRRIRPTHRPCRLQNDRRLVMKTLRRRAIVALFAAGAVGALAIGTRAAAGADAASADSLRKQIMALQRSIDQLKAQVAEQQENSAGPRAGGKGERAQRHGMQGRCSKGMGRGSRSRTGRPQAGRGSMEKGRLCGSCGHHSGPGQNAHGPRGMREPGSFGQGQRACRGRGMRGQQDFGPTARRPFGFRGMGGGAGHGQSFGSPRGPMLPMGRGCGYGRMHRRG